VVDACDFVILEVVHGNDADFEVLMRVNVLSLGAREIDGLVYCLPRSVFFPPVQEQERCPVLRLPIIGQIAHIVS
jgi:hypothetical protein